MASVVAAFAPVTLVLAAVLQIKGRLRISCLLLLVFPVVLSAAAFLSYSQGTGGNPGTDLRSDQNMAIFCASLVGLSALALRPRWRWLFWLAWLPNAIACGTLVYLVFFWHVFS